MSLLMSYTASAIVIESASVWTCEQPSGGTHLNEGDPAGAGRAAEVGDGHLAVVLQVALLAQHVVDAGHHLVPLVVVAVAEHRKHGLVVLTGTSTRVRAHVLLEGSFQAHFSSPL